MRIFRAFCSLSIFVAAYCIGTKAWADLPPGQVAVPIPQPQPAPPVTQQPQPPALQVAEPEEESEIAFYVGKLGGGLLVAEGLPTAGGYVRLGMTDVLFSAEDGAKGEVGGVWSSIEGWLAKDGRGIGMPFGIYLGLLTDSSPALFLAGGPVFNLFTFDQVKDQTGFGLLSLGGGLRVGMRAGPVLLAIESDVHYRWRWKLDDVVVFRAGLSGGLMFGLPSPPRTPTRAE